MLDYLKNIVNAINNNDIKAIRNNKNALQRLNMDVFTIYILITDKNVFKLNKSNNDVYILLNM